MLFRLARRTFHYLSARQKEYRLDIRDPYPIYDLSDKSRLKTARLPFMLHAPHDKINISPLSEIAKPNPLAVAAVILSNLYHDTRYSSAEYFYREYFERVQLQNCSEYFGLNNALSMELNGASPLAECWPWLDISPHQAELQYVDAINKEYLVHDVYNSRPEYNFYTGPATTDKVKYEIFRLTRVMESILRKGYISKVSEDGDIIGWLMLDGDRWAVHVHSGLHRLAALVGLGFNLAPVRINKIIDSERISNWPNVRSGLFTRSEALSVFKKCTLSHLSVEASSWLRSINMQSQESVDTRDLVLSSIGIVSSFY